MNKSLEIKIIVIYAFLFLVTIIILQQFWFNGLFDASNFINWDAGHYHFIKTNGYEGSRVAFFPLFILLWKFLSLDRYGISILNTIFFLFSFYLLIKELKIKNILETALYLSIPSFIFFYLPYSESVFFLTSVLILMGFKKQKNYLVYIGLFFAILSRPAFSIFIPALIITEVLSKHRDGIYSRIGMYTLLSFLGIGLVGFIQYLDTGEWFQFFSAQKNWGNELQLPRWPLRSWGSGFALGIDAFACLVGIISGSLILGLLFKVKRFQKIVLPREVIFSLSYLGGITLLILLFRGGSLFSLNRFVFATPFIIVVFHYWMSQNIHLKFQKLLLIFILISIFWTLFRSFVDLKEFVKYTMLAFYATLVFAVKSDQKNIQKYSLLLLIFLNFCFQIISYVGFLSGKWIG